MIVEVKVATILTQKTNPPLTLTRFSLELEDGSNVMTLIGKLGIPEKFVGSVIVNKKRAGREHVLEHGDSVAILPAISGG